MQLPKPIEEQVIVITGASSGIGREAALEFARRGAKLVLAARGEVALQQVATEVQQSGGEAHVVVTDVGEWEQVERLARLAVERFGRIDTWVNNAAVSTYAKFEEMTVDEIDQVLRVDLLGPIYGAKAALAKMRPQRSGTIITIGSALGERSLPLMSMYCTAKHGVKGFIESLRVELEREDSGIHLTLIMPASINTPFYSHARSKRGVRPRPYPPVYAPQVVAEAIVHAAEHPQRDIYAGGAARAFSVFERISPALLDWYLLQGDRAFRNMLTERPDHGGDNLFHSVNAQPSSDGEFSDEAKRSSFYTRNFELRSRPWIAIAALAGLAGLAGALWFQKSPSGVRRLI